MSFGSPLVLLTLLLLPLVACFSVLLARRRARYPISFTNLEVLAEVARARTGGSVRRRVPLALLLLALAVAGAALARPQIGKSVVEKHSVVVLLVDISGSMEATDVKPSRIAAAITAMQVFVNKLPPEAHIGLVEFGTEPEVIALPTTDHASVYSSLSYLSPNGATALGDGLSTAVEVVKQSTADIATRVPGTSVPPSQGNGGKGVAVAPGAIVLLSDGAQNRGTIQPGEAALQAKAAGIPVYTIAFGTPNGTVSFVGYQQKFPAPPDPKTMESIARVTGAKTFTAGSAAQVSDIYKQLGSALGRRHEERNLAAWFDLLAAVVLIGAMLSARVLGPVL